LFRGVSASAVYHDRSKSLSVDPPPKCVVFCVAGCFHLHHLQLQPHLRVRPPQSDPLPRPLGKDEDNDARVLERPRIREAEHRAGPSAAELLAMY
jgi:hypothetical protein